MNHSDENLCVILMSRLQGAQHHNHSMTHTPRPLLADLGKASPKYHLTAFHLNHAHASRETCALCWMQHEQARTHLLKALAGLLSDVHLTSHTFAVTLKGHRQAY